MLSKLYTEAITGKARHRLSNCAGRSLLFEREGKEVNVYDTANKLAKELRESNEYIEYKKIKADLDQNQEVKEKIKAFEQKRYEVQLEALKGEEQEKTKLEEMQKIYIKLMENELAKNYFSAELKFNVLIADVNKIIAESVQDVIK